MRMITRLSASILAPAVLVEATKDREREEAKVVLTETLKREAQSLVRGTVEPSPHESRTQRRARERMERKAKRRAAKVQS